MTSQTLPVQAADASAAEDRAAFESEDAGLAGQVLSRGCAGLPTGARGQHGGPGRTRSVLSPAGKLDRDQRALSSGVTGARPGLRNARPGDGMTVSAVACQRGRLSPSRFAACRHRFGVPS